MNSLELFCGTKSFTKIARKYCDEVVTTDIQGRFNPDICCDVMDLDVEDGRYDIIWASPPCEGFSVASCGKHWNTDYSAKSERAVYSLQVIERTVELIGKVKPKYWFIENPRGMLRKLIGRYLEVLEYKRETVSYCRYGDTRMKPTDIWTNCFEWVPIDRMCANGNTDHDAAPRGSRTGTQGIKTYEEKSVIPSLLFEDIFSSIRGAVTEDRKEDRMARQLVMV
jgi:hypothetical protein